MDLLPSSLENLIIKNVLGNNQAAFIAQLSLKGMALIGLAPNLKQAEELSWENQITSHPVEEGANVSDHIITGSLNIKQTFIVTSFNSFSIPGMIILSPILTILMELRKTKQIITVLSSFKIHRNMVIQSINAKLAEGVENTVICDIAFKELQFASTTTATVSASTMTQKTLAARDNTFNVASAAPVSTSAFVGADAQL
ncbi:MAG: hypothetical protein LBJ71_01610 [Holosporaceae bacterium]|jgi:hypothetical protein|nr:hypothetical protein [Holosporaceae bacterium]